MDIFSLLSYINKVSLLAFFVTVVVVGYQIYVLKKEKTNEKAPAIPDFKEGIKSNEAANYTSLPGSLTKRDNKPVNYSRLIFLTIFLLTAVVVVFVLILAKKNNRPLNTETTPPIIANSITPTIAIPSPTATLEANLALSPSPTIILPVSPTINPSLTTTGRINPSPTEISTPTPTEIILAKAPSVTPTVTTTVSNEDSSKIQTLPETGSIQKGLLIIGVAISTIFFSFWF
jgi:hypothetical protein